MLNFGYKEFNTGNELLDREDGNIPGLTFGLTGNWQHWSADIKLTYHQGIVDYTGQTQGGIPVTSKTDTEILDYSISISRWITIQNKKQFAIYIGYGQHTWQRNIRSTFTSNGTPVNGLNEKYSWDYAQIGGKFELYKKSRNQWMIDVQYNYMLNADINVDFKSFDPVTLQLGKKWGLRLSSPYQFEIKNQLFIRLEPYYENWEINRSETKRLSINGVLINIAVTEPRSETQNFGINLSVVKIF